MQINEPLSATSQPQDHSGTSGYSDYVTAPSYFDDTASIHPSTQRYPHPDEPEVLQAIDRGSGAVFERVCQGTEGEVDARAAPMNLTRLSTCTTRLRIFVGPLYNFPLVRSTIQDSHGTNYQG